MTWGGGGLRNFIITGNAKTHNLERYFNKSVFNFEELKSAGFQRKHAVKLVGWEPRQHLSEDRENPRRPESGWPVAGPAGFKPKSSQQSGKVWKSPTLPQHACCRVIANSDCVSNPN